jgi:hypothetical protein
MAKSIMVGIYGMLCALRKHWRTLVAGSIIVWQDWEGQSIVEVLFVLLLAVPFLLSPVLSCHEQMCFCHSILSCTES